MVELAFTTRIPLAVMIVMGIKQWENRSAMPRPWRGRCAMTCSKSSDSHEYDEFLNWARWCFPEEWLAQLPTWQQVACWQGKMIAVCDYKAGYIPGNLIWNEGYPVWWHLSNVQLLDELIPCQGKVGIWNLPPEIAIKL